MGFRNMGKMGAGYDDEQYSSPERAYAHPKNNPYYPLFRRVVTELMRARAASVLEVGCGTGILAGMLLEAGIDYHGFDHSTVAVRKARERNPAADLWVASALEERCYRREFDAIVSCEVLEHIEDDRGVVALWPQGTLCVCSLPNFDHEDHFRVFRREEDIVERFGDLIDIKSMQRLASSPGAGLTWSEYFRRIRWAREDPKTLLGIFGLNRFDWYSGWFVVVGRRR